MYTDKRLYSPTGSVYRLPPKCDDYRQQGGYDSEGRYCVYVTKELEVGTIREESMVQAGSPRKDVQDQNRGQKAENVES